MNKKEYEKKSLTNRCVFGVWPKLDIERDEWQEAMNKIEWCLPCENQNTETIAGVEAEESEEMSPITQIRMSNYRAPWR